MAFDWYKIFDSTKGRFPTFVAHWKKLVEVIVGTSSTTPSNILNKTTHNQYHYTTPSTFSLDPGIGPTLLPSNSRHAHNFTSFQLCVVALGYQGNPQLLQSPRGQSIRCELWWHVWGGQAHFILFLILYIIPQQRVLVGPHRLTQPH